MKSTMVAFGSGKEQPAVLLRAVRSGLVCGAPIGERHRAGCDIERCHHCGWQALGCLHFDPNDARRQAWNGKWPGEDDCERLDFFVNGDPIKLITRVGYRCRQLLAIAVGAMRARASLANRSAF
jgi:hypothetical protein